MKKITLLILLLTLGLNSFAQVPKIPLVEHFTQASCTPCAQQNPGMYNTLNTFGSSNYTKVTYQTSWPGYDPMHIEYQAGPNNRVLYYSVSGVPDANINGGPTNSPNTAITTATLNAAASLTTPYKINIDQSWSAGPTLTVNVSVVNTTGAVISDADRLHLAMVEDHIHFNTAPGSNGETDFYYVVRDMINASTGISSTAGLTISSIPANDSLYFTLQITNIPSYIRDLNQLSFVAFVQNNSSRVVYQSGKSSPGGAFGLFPEANSVSIVGSEYCDYTFLPAIEIINNGTTILTSAIVEYSINGGSSVSETYTGSISLGQSDTVFFPTAQLPSGSSIVSYEVISVNSTSTFISPSAVLIEDEEYHKLLTTSSSTPISEGFQGYVNNATAPTGVISDNPDGIRAFIVNESIATLGYNLGGHGLSDGCFRWDYYDIAAGLNSKLIWEKLDLTNSNNTKISFNHAYAQYTNETDRLVVNVSTDCGVTWNPVWDKQGTQLATAPPLGSARFYPSVNQWISDTVDLSSYDGMDDVVISFQGISAYGNSLYVDDINLSSDITTSLNTKRKDNNQLTIFPNPTTAGYFNIETNIVIEKITLFDMMGRELIVPINMEKGIVNVSSLKSGNYLVKVLTNGQIKTLKIAVSN